MSETKIKYQDVIEEGNFIMDVINMKNIPYTFPSDEYDALVKAAEDVELIDYHGIPCFKSEILEKIMGIKIFNIAHWQFY